MGVSQSGVLHGHEVVVDAAGVSSALGGETSDQLVGAYKSMQGYRSAVVIATATNIVNTQTVTLSLLQATAAAGTGSKALTARETSSARTVATGTATATDLFELICEVQDTSLDVAGGFGYITGKLVTNDTDGTEVVSIQVLRFK